MIQKVNTKLKRAETVAACVFCGHIDNSAPLKTKLWDPVTTKLGALFQIIIRLPKNLNNFDRFPPV